MMAAATHRELRNLEQAEQLDRVEGNLTQLIVDWYNNHETGHEFHLGEFTRDILNIRLCSPTSPFRIMADLRRKGIVNYKVINRAKSLYRTMPLDNRTVEEHLGLDTNDFFEGA
jgi:hypothetical protein